MNNRLGLGLRWFRSQRTQPTRLGLDRQKFQRNVSTQSVPFSKQRIILPTTILAGVFAATTVYFSRDAFAEAPNFKPKSSLLQSTQPLESMPEIYYDISDENINAAKEEFLKFLDKKRVNTELGARIAASSTEWSKAPRGDLDRPAMIVYPHTTEEVSKIAKICHRRRIPMIGFSGGTSLEGTLAATQGGVCINFQQMNKIIAIHGDDGDVVVQPGLGYEELNETLAAQQLFFPPDPGPGACIGGMISQGCSGTNAFRYGTMKDWVLGMTVVLADGTIVKTRGRPRKSSSGYNLTQVLVGSEGTLGLVTEACLKLTKRPENEQVGVASFPSTQKAVETAVKVVRSGLQVGAMELLCPTTMRAVNLGGYVDKEFPEIPHLFFKFAAPSKIQVDEQIKQVEDMARSCGCRDFEFSKTEEESQNLWAARKTALWSILALKNDPSDDFLSSDTCVPISSLADAVNEAEKLASDTGFISSFIGHVGDGNFHTAILFPEKDRDKARKVITEIQKQAIKYDGTITGEHGVGLEYRERVVDELGAPAVDMMRQIKMALDPYCLLNPDKVFRLKIAPRKDEEE